MPKIHELETPRLRLREWKVSDRALFAQLNADPRVMEYFPSVLSRSESDALADRIQSLMARCGWGWWAVEVKNLHDFIGFVGLHVPSADLPFNPCVEVGWRLAFPYWGCGYATEAAQASLAFGFETLALEKIVSFTALTNQRSQAVMERLGMTRAAKPFLHPSVPAGHPLQAHCLYELVETEWHRR